MHRPPGPIRCRRRRAGAEPAAVQRRAACAYLVVERKIGRFDPTYVGQLGIYVAVVDDQLRRVDRHAPTVGILLCKSRNDTLVRYALAGAPAPLTVADYTYDTLPPQERGPYLRRLSSPPPSSLGVHRPAPSRDKQRVPTDPRHPGSRKDGSYGNRVAPG